MKRICLLLVMLICHGTAVCQCSIGEYRETVHYSHRDYHDHDRYFAVPFFFPTFSTNSTGYGTVPAAPVPPAPAPQPAANQNAVLDAIRQLDANVRALATRVESLEKTGLAPPMPPADPKPKDPFNPGPTSSLRSPSHVGSVSFVNMAVNKCASCHESGVASAKGGGVVILLGRTLSPSVGYELGQAIRDAVDTGRMPLKGGPLDDHDKAIVAQAFPKKGE